MDCENVLGESKFPTYEQLKSGLIRLIEEGKITREDAGMILPQLRESEDERIRKAIVATIEQCPDDFLNPKNRDRMLDWLEKQKDHFRDDTKMVEKQDYSGLNDLERAIHRGFLSTGVENVPVAIIKETANECKRIANENANAEWSEEDEEMYARIVRRYTNYEGVIMRTKEESVANKMLDAMAQEEIWLKSLRPQSHWKPSEEQMKALRNVAYKNGNSSLSPYSISNNSLYEELKKLGMKEEPEYYQHFDQDC